MGEYIPASEEAVSERQKDALDQIAQLRKDVDDRFTFKTGGILKGYLEGRLEIRLKLRARGCGEEFHCVLRRANPEILETKVTGCCYNREPGFEVHRAQPVAPPDLSLDREPHIICVGEARRVSEALPGFRTDHKTGPIPKREITNLPACSEVDRHEPKAVFVSPVPFVEHPEQGIASTVRFERADKGYSGGGELFLFSKGRFEFIRPKAEGELDFCVGSLLNLYDNLGEHVVQRRSEIMEDFSDDNGKLGRRHFCKLESPNFLVGIRVVLGNNFVRAAIDKGADDLVDLLDLGFGPLGLQKRPYKRGIRFHDTESIMAKADPTKASAFKKVVGVFLNTPPNPKKAKAKRRKSPAKKKKAK